MMMMSVIRIATSLNPLELLQRSFEASKLNERNQKNRITMEAILGDLLCHPVKLYLYFCLFAIATPPRALAELEFVSAVSAGGSVKFLPAM